MERNDTALTGVKMMIADGIVTQEAAEKYFPELKKSKDERTQLTEFLWDLIYKGSSFRYKREDFERWKDWLEKQGDQKPDDKVEPKFHKGEWVTNGIETVQITGYDIDYGYQVDYKGNLQHRDTDVIEKEYHLWTIQDAKDGDVLVTPLPKECEAGVQIFLFKEINSRWYAKNCVEFYCRVCQGVFKKPNETVFMGKASGTFYPATKEQRDVFFAKMHEAGYEWDAEKKELKKIEQKSADTWKPSEEQIKVLEFFIPYVTKCSVVLQKSKDTLLSLLSDLKKLREE